MVDMSISMLTGVALITVITLITNFLPYYIVLILVCFYVLWSNKLMETKC